MISTESYSFLSHLNSRMYGLMLFLILSATVSARASTGQMVMSEPALKKNPLFTTLTPVAPSTTSATDPEKWSREDPPRTNWPVSPTDRAALMGRDFTLLRLRVNPPSMWSDTSPYADRGKYQYQDHEETRDQESDQPENGQERETYPDPVDVLYRSMIIPGWGQVTNKQVWKVPIIYGLFAGLGYYNYTLTRQYHGYRAAYYNATREGENDFRYGQTPDFIPEGLTSQEIRDTRDRLRNQRDFSYVMIFLAYGLNLLDAYVYAHMRSFDVSDDLSAEAVIAPGVMEQGGPGVHLRVSLFNR